MRYKYQDSSLPIDQRVADLVSRMTLNQKVRQLTSMMFMGKVEPGKLENMTQDGLGQFVIYMQASSKETAEVYRQIQDKVVEQNEWGIPAIIHSEALTGLQLAECAVFPASISLGASFLPEIVRDIGERVRYQMLNFGIRQALSPNFDIIRDFRWGRTAEAYGGDPTHVAVMGCAYVEGLQGDNLANGVIATPKHFLGYSQTEGAMNGTKTSVDWHDLRMNFAKPYETAIRKVGLRTVMNSYGEYNGQTICANKSLLTDLLREDLGFEGYVSSDYMSVQQLTGKTKQAETAKEAAVMSFKAGLDLELPVPYGYWPHLCTAVKNGELEESLIDSSVARVLRNKFELGLFEKPYGDFEPIDNTENDKQSAVVSDCVITLTKNDGILPIENRNAKIAVIGPCGEFVRMLQGGYSYPAFFEMMTEMMHSGKSGMVGVEMNTDDFIMDESKEEIDMSETVGEMLKKQHPGALSTFEAIKEHFPNAIYAKGCHVKDKNMTDSEEAKKAARDADYVIMTVGGKVGAVSSCTNGEGMDDVDIILPGGQSDLIKEVFSVNSNMVVVHTNNKPLIDSFAYENVPAILEAWLPGPFGGIAISRALAGITNPGGRLPVDVPRHVGQTPIYHYQQNGSRSDKDKIALNPNGYMSESSKSQLPFGYGLSYTKFKYLDGKMHVKYENGIPIMKISITVKNVGERDGDEVVQLYGMDLIGSIIRPQNELLGFKRVSIKIDEAVCVVFSFKLDQMAFPNIDGKWVIEKGDFQFYIGTDANTPVYSIDYHQDETLGIDYTKRGFCADAEIIRM